jgi:hypothetical protein
MLEGDLSMFDVGKKTFDRGEPAGGPPQVLLPKP